MRVHRSESSFRRSTLLPDRSTGPPAREGRRLTVVVRSLVGRLPFDLGLVRSSAIVFLGTGVARLLAFLFYIAAARLLAPAEYGVLAYALAFLSAVTLLLTNSPDGLSRFLARNLEDRYKQDVYYTNWAALVGIGLIVSIAAFLPLAPLTNLTGWLAVGVVANLVNAAVFETYVQTQRGLQRFWVLGVYYSLANFLQLAAILVAGWLGLRSAALFFLFFGISAVAAAGLLRLVSRTPLRLRPTTIAWRHLLLIARYVAPIIAQGVFFACWWGIDVILLEHLLDPTATANYAAGKTLTQVLMLAPAAISLAAVPRIARMAESDVRRSFARLLGLTSVVIVPVAAGLALLQGPIMQLIYGDKYPHVLDAFATLVLGVALYGFAIVIVSVWGALGRPWIGAVATGAGTVVTIALTLLLVPRLDLLGAAIGFAAGAGTQLVVLGAFTIYGLYLGATVRVGHLPDEAMLNLDDA